MQSIIVYLEVYFMHVFEEEEQEAAVVHLLAELGQGDVALLLAVRAEQEGGDGDQVLADILLGLLLVTEFQVWNIGGSVIRMSQWKMSRIM